MPLEEIVQLKVLSTRHLSLFFLLWYFNVDVKLS